MDPKLLANYRGKQEAPVFLHDDPELRAEEAWGPRLALIAAALFGLGFAGFLAYLYFT